jgi:hypothetical protein
VSRVIGASSFAGGAEWLARVSTANNVRSFDCCPVDVFDVSMIYYLGPMLFKNFVAVGVYFGLPYYLHASAL